MWYGPVMRKLVQGARCRGSAFHGLPCPGRLVAVRDSQQRAGVPARFRCNGPDAHEFEIPVPRDVAPLGLVAAAAVELPAEAARLIVRM
jgi:hypothetical protein